jgi:PadR family transcriptional regulator, regulatory protein PadR
MGMTRQPNTSQQTLRVLRLLLEEPTAWHYGYEISQRTGLKSGTLYPILIRLADQGWLETRWAEPQRQGRPARHTYRLTPVGSRCASVLVAKGQGAGAVQRPGAQGAIG